MGRTSVLWRGTDRHPSLHSLVAAVLVLSLMAYVLSYAPVYRMLNGRDVLETRSFDFEWDHLPAMTGYRPVEWLIETTPLQDPLLSWAELWGVRGGIEIDAFMRVQTRQSAEQE